MYMVPDHVHVSGPSAIDSDILKNQTTVYLQISLKLIFLHCSNAPFYRALHGKQVTSVPYRGKLWRG